ncbi:hypothetical protein BWQ96_06821 [Gracilariopsis chorda]|uniref:Uncharacterized protein n=1 Tax=Gracilariopsis chorda TaxID=448386 RepID=A0A2V3IMW4_9FLOR|nr:hypothetical protein BWQ96_06821 [Gracilariopsis chorda]|eukprot:PXF43431.1 hypothetical protein BWQ96_06821 [Gracilariopsis chorda]
MKEDAYTQFLTQITASERKMLANEVERAMKEACAATKTAQLARLLPKGTTVRITGLQRCAHLNERQGTVLGVFDGERIPLRVQMKDDAYEEVRVRLANLRPCKADNALTTRRHEIIETITNGPGVDEQDTPVAVLWLLNKGGNIGEGDLFATLCSKLTCMRENNASNPLQRERMTLKQVHEICKKERFELNPSRLCDKFGLPLLCYSNPSHPGKSNVLATYFTCNADTGLAPHDIFGPAMVIRLSPSTGEPVDFEYGEAVRAFGFINDLMEWYPSPPLCEGEGFPHFFKAIAACYPYYDTSCQMQLKGFIGRRKEVQLLDDGTLLKDPEHLMPLPSHVF